MSDEAAFLAALKANPADDTARLVYADWLDEHNEPMRAEYLRLVVEVARKGDNVANHPDGSRMSALAKELPANWRLAAGSRFALVLNAFSDLVKTVKWLREITGDGLGEAKAACEAAPHPIYSCVPFDMAFAAYSNHPVLSADVRVLPSERYPEMGNTDYQLVLTCYFPRPKLPHAVPAEREAQRALSQFLTATGLLSTEEELRSALRGEVVVLRERLTFDQARAQMGELTAFFQPCTSPYRWYLSLNLRPTPDAASNR